MYQNVSNEVLLAWFKFQTNIPSRFGVQYQRESDKNTPRPSPPLYKDERLRDVNIGNQILGVSSVMLSYLIDYDSLFQTEADISTKCDSFFITKCNRSFLHNASGILLQNATVLLAISTGITRCDDFITKYDSFYKMRRLLQSATVQLSMTSVNKPYFRSMEIYN